MTLVAVDTNVLVYRYDMRDPGRQRVAATVLRQLGESGQGIVPAQCLAEFSKVGLRKLSAMLTPQDVAEAVRLLRGVFDSIPLTPAVVLEALRGVQQHQMSYYDAQVWAAARLRQAEFLITEDFTSGSTVGDITFVNPFVEEGRAALADVLE